LKLRKDGCIIGDQSGKITHGQSKKIKVIDTVVAVGSTEGQPKKRDLDNFFKLGGDSKCKSTEMKRI